MTRAVQGATTGTEGRIDQYMGALLRTGVILAAIIVLIGGVIYLTRHAGPAPNYREFHGEPAELRSISGILHGALSLRGRGLIQLGLLLLIATPIARVEYSDLRDTIENIRSRARGEASGGYTPPAGSRSEPPRGEGSREGSRGEGSRDRDTWPSSPETVRGRHPNEIPVSRSPWK